MVSDANYYRELLSLTRELRAAFGELHAFSWTPGQTRNHTVKAVGAGEDQGETLYGDDARAALAQKPAPTSRLTTPTSQTTNRPPGDLFGVRADTGRRQNERCPVWFPLLQSPLL